MLIMIAIGIVDSQQDTCDTGYYAARKSQPFAHTVSFRIMDDRGFVPCVISCEDGRRVGDGGYAASSDEERFHAGVGAYV